MKIEDTILQIIADANKLKHISGNLYVDPKGNKFVANQYGFTPETIYNTQFLEINFKNELHSLRLEITRLKTSLDECDFDRIEAVKKQNTKVDLSGELKHLKMIYDDVFEKNKRLKEEIGMIKMYVKSKLGIEKFDKKEFESFREVKVKELKYESKK